ncbi:MAG: Na/Pi cotransporter family protein [Lachnospiraceae bacterium]|nr:Na/Pi cotransporter family protein [Lachnospiraceae bacterium]
MTTIEILKLVTGMLSGLALFLFGMNVMSEAMAQLAGGRLSVHIERITGNRLAGWGFGTVVAALVQSSATTVMTVGLVSSGIMTLMQASGIMIGANMGTTATAWLLSLNSLGGSLWIEFLKPSTFTPFIGVAAVVLLMFTRSERVKKVGSILVGFSVMMIGMTLMGDAVAPLQGIPAFKSMLLSFSNPVLSFGIAVLCTLLIQSSAGTIGILQALATSVGITYGMAIPLVCGAQAGTCLTAIMVSLSSNNNGKRAALVHLYYNLLRNIPFLVILTVVNSIVHLPLLAAPASAVGIATFHSVINVVGSIIFLPLSGLLVRLAEKTIPFNEAEKREQSDKLTMLDPLLLRNPGFALVQAETATGLLSDTVREAFDEFLQVFEEKGDEHGTKGSLLCERARHYSSQLKKYYVEISERPIKDEDARKLSSLRGTTDDYAEICEKLSSLLKEVVDFKKKNGSFSPEAWSDLELFGRAVQEILDTTVHDFEFRNPKLAGTIQVFREVVTGLHGKISKKHIKRLHRGTCKPENNILFTDICLGYERIIDRCDSIAGHILAGIDEERVPVSDEQYRLIKTLYGDKYSILDE